MFRVLRLTLTSSAVVQHLSLADSCFTYPQDNGEWLKVLKAVRGQLLHGLQVNAVRIALNYMEHEAKDGGEATFSVLKDIEAGMKTMNFRWFQLSNYADGRRGQIMNGKRAPGEECTQVNTMFEAPSRLINVPSALDEEEN